MDAKTRKLISYLEEIENIWLGKIVSRRFTDNTVVMALSRSGLGAEGIVYGIKLRVKYGQFMAQELIGFLIGNKTIVSRFPNAPVLPRQYLMDMRRIVLGYRSSIYKRLTIEGKSVLEIDDYLKEITFSGDGSCNILF